MALTILKQFIRKGGKRGVTKGHPYGVLVARLTTEPNGEKMVRFGWSLCDHRDQFDKHVGTRLANERTLRPLVIEDLPHDVRKAIKPFIERSVRYFSGQ